MPPAATRTSNFLTNVLWSWSGVAVNLFAGFFLSPFLIRRLGDDNFGIWTLVLAMVEYYWLLDLGFRNATVKYAAHYRALDQPLEVNRVINTGLLYSFIVSAITFALTLFGRSHFTSLFHSNKPIFGTLLLIVGVSWSIGMIFNVFNAGLEGFQRFDITSRLWIVATAFRSLVTLVLVLKGYGLREMALVLLASQLFIYFAGFLSFRRIFPALRISPRLANVKTLKEMAAFASHNFAISISTRVLTQSPVLLIGMKLPSRFAAYFSVPQKLLDYPLDAIGRFGVISGTTAADLCARGDWAKIARLGIWANRYCAALYFFLVAFLTVYGKQFLTVWLTPQFAEQSAPLLPILLIGAAANSSQYNSACILVNSGGQKWYARLLMAEAALFLLLVPTALTIYGLIGAALVMATLTLLSRGIGVSLLLSRRIGMPYASFLFEIYAIPFSIAAFAALILFLLKTYSIPGLNWPQLLLAGAIGGTIYFVLAFFFVLNAEHRESGLAHIRGIAGRFAGGAPRPA